MKKTVFLGLILLFVSSLVFAADPTTTEELLARHQDAIGTAQARAAAASRGLTGSTQFEYTRRNWNQKGAGVMKIASSGPKFRLYMGLNTETYYVGEDIIFDGNKSRIAGRVAGRQSALAAFLDQNPALLRDGVFTGVLSTGWALLDPAAHNAKLKYSGRKKIDGEDLLELKYEPKKGGEDVVIKMYFDPATYRHVMTTYVARAMMPPGRSETAANRSMAGEQSSQSHQILRERFGGFNTVDGITLPSQWSLAIFNDFDPTNIMKWDSTIDDTAHVAVDPATFQAN